ncbi:MAG: lytic transglycosylase domain-containing protein [Opitutales bacterium]
MPAQTPPPPPVEAKPTAHTQDELYDLGKALFDEYAPPEVKAQYDFPTSRQWDEFAGRLQQALEQNDLRALAAYEPEARAALAALRALPDYADYAEWLEARLDYIEAARLATGQPPIVVPPQPPVARPGQPLPALVPYYDLWVRRIQARRTPDRAASLLPVLRAAFVAEGVPGEFAWIAEAESTFNPAARSPAGAKGLFQLMPETAQGLGLRTFLPDERTDPEKSARAAARYLKALHGRFGDWPLTLAAYNAGEGRVRRLLDRQGAKTFAEIALALPAETRMYVPKVLAIMEVRTGVAPGQLDAPTAG